MSSPRSPFHPIPSQQGWFGHRPSPPSSCPTPALGSEPAPLSLCEPSLSPVGKGPHPAPLCTGQGDNLPEPQEHSPFFPPPLGTTELCFPSRPSTAPERLFPLSRFRTEGLVPPHPAALGRQRWCHLSGRGGALLSPPAGQRWPRPAGGGCRGRCRRTPPEDWRCSAGW